MQNIYEQWTWEIYDRAIKISDLLNIYDGRFELTEDRKDWIERTFLRVLDARSELECDYFDDHVNSLFQRLINARNKNPNLEKDSYIADRWEKLLSK